MLRRTSSKTYLGVLVFVVATACTAAAGRTIYVDDDGPADFTTIQAAIDDCNHGDAVVVCEGRYYEIINLNGKNITLRSIDPNDPNVVDRTVISGGGYNDNNEDPVVTFKSGEDSNCVLSGLTITGGYSVLSDGAGIYCYYSSPTIINCVIRGNETECYGGGMYNENSNPFLVNCLFSGNSAVYYDNGASGGGMYNRHSNPTLINCTFSGNETTESGAGICNYDSSPIIINCTFKNNDADSGGAISNGRSSPLITNCAFIENSAWDGGVMSNYWSSPTLINCTLAANSAHRGNAISCYSWQREDPSNIVITNCIIWDVVDEIWNYDDSTITITYSNVQGGWPGEGNIDADPRFYYPGCWLDPNTPNEPSDDVWVEGIDYHLRSDSPCIDAADNFSVPADWTDLDEDCDINESIPFDLDGNSRFSDDPNTFDTGNGTPPIIDMGAYEGSKEIFSFLLSTEIVIVPEGQTATFTVALGRDPLDTIEVTVNRIAGDSDITVESGATLTFDSSNYSNSQTVTLAAKEDIDPYHRTALIWIDAPGFVPAVVNATEQDNDRILSIVYVDADAPGVNNGRSWHDAFNYLKDALTYTSMVPEVRQIRVAEGVYKPNQRMGSSASCRGATFSLINGVTLKGGYAGFGEPDPNARDIKKYETILSGDLNGDDGSDFDNNAENSYHVVTSGGTDETAALNGFTITSGNAYIPYAGMTDPRTYGGGMYNVCGSPTVIDCTFRENSAEHYGAGMYNHKANPTLTNCTFTDNWVVLNKGGGMYNRMRSNPTMINCTFIGNSGGGGVWNDSSSSPTLTNCIFIGNFARFNAGGMYSYYGTPILTNCTFSGNSCSRNGGGMHNNRCSPILTNCTFSNNSAELGGGIYNNPETEQNRRSYPTLTNCILWGNTDSGGSDESAQIYDGEPTINYSCVQGWSGALGGIGNIDADPCFVEPGYWANVADPNIPIEPNDPNAIWVDGDYHLRSQAGRWDPNSETWVQDAVNSPCIDAGDSNFDWTAELWPHGKRINMGAYGGTPEASMSLSDVGNIGNLDNDPDDNVDFNDLDLFISKWLKEGVLMLEDLNRNGVVNFIDYAIFGDHWLEGTIP